MGSRTGAALVDMPQGYGRRVPWAMRPEAGLPHMDQAGSRAGGYPAGMQPFAHRPPRCVHYVGFRDDRYWNAYRIFGGPRVIHRRWDFYATRDVGPDDVVIFAEGDETQPVAERNATDLDERWL